MLPNILRVSEGTCQEARWLLRARADRDQHDVRGNLARIHDRPQLPVQSELLTGARRLPKLYRNDAGVQARLPMDR